MRFALGNPRAKWSPWRYFATSLPPGLTILDSTQIDKDANGVGIDGNGWIGEMTIPSALVTDATFDPTKVTLTVTDPGFDATGAATTVTRTIRGGAVIRRQYPNQTSNLQTQSGSGVLVRFSLTDQIYQGSTISAVSVASGYFGTKPGGSATVTNNSSRTYAKPLFAWLNFQLENVSTSSYSVEAVAYHRHSQQGRQVACIKFTAKDAQATPNVTAAQTVSTPALSSLQTQGQIVEAYKASIPLSSLTQLDVCQVSAKVYPWLGDSTAILDLETDGIAWPTMNPQTELRFLNDKNGTYGGATAYVKAGAGGTPQVSLTAATARANPYATIDAAMLALRTFNNANRSHNDCSGGTIYFMDDGAGGAVTHSSTGTGNPAGGLSLYYWKPDPQNTAAVTIAKNASTMVQGILSCSVNLSVTTGQIFDGGTSTNSFYLALHDCSVTLSGGYAGHWAYRTGLTPMRNVTFKGQAGAGFALGLGGDTTIRNSCPLALGVVMDPSFTVTADLITRGYAVIGCSFFRVSPTDYSGGTAGAYDTTDGDIWANNKFMQLNTPLRLLTGVSRTKGCALVQNVLECSFASPAKAAEMGADSAVAPFDRVIVHYNSIVGERFNFGYNDAAGSVGVVKRASLRYNITEYFNIKSDTYISVTTATGRVGNHSIVYQSGSFGNINLGGSQDGHTVGDPSSWLGMYWPPDSDSNIGPSNVTFTDNKGVRANGGVTSAGMGTYTLTGATNGAYNRVASGMAGLAFDLAGIARKNDGTGAAGAYERTV